ncbi:MAG TPA: YqgE/AlgH family protein [Flavobacteriales bacterium]|nr:YqgE/AlgH family protein [Flavobacteriales bacterium]MCB0785145.1 YqgE/AlgH family protein [Flavobacteriales bacterium]MCB0807742.1 YqgE/AlgH family protein [Flavobacteriales bacterium]MCB9181231.1 YqgE/AlgH family protein [Flavobacteriales bacterium]MCB9199390.1 YqgE/AlgH family protein [Flavobacteriales bacterium]
MSKDLLDLRPENVLEPAQGRLLVSEPFLSDPYFRRTVILLCTHDEQGAFGLVLNRSIEVDLDDLLPGHSLAGARVGIGGPVQTDVLYFLHTIGKHLAGSVPVFDDVHLGGDMDQLQDLVKADPGLLRHVRFFIGYSGWSAGQLERELGERSWLVAHATTRQVMARDDEDVWRETLRGMGGRFAPLANFPEDPRSN